MHLENAKVVIVPYGLAIKFTESPAAKFNAVHKTEFALARLNLMRQDLFRQQLLYRGGHFIDGAERSRV